MSFTAEGSIWWVAKRRLQDAPCMRDRLDDSLCLPAIAESACRLDGPTGHATRNEMRETDYAQPESRPMRIVSILCTLYSLVG